eukprot:7252963-Alexandrium_andersonii.AAC.1
MVNLEAAGCSTCASLKTFLDGPVVDGFYAWMPKAKGAISSGINEPIKFFQAQVAERQVELGNS